jgi:hypothetical protein
VELSYAQNFRTLADGMQFEQVFVGYSSQAHPRGIEFGEPNQYRVSGTVRLALRRYTEGRGFTPHVIDAKEEHPHYFTTDNIPVVNQVEVRHHALHWNLTHESAPIEWVISPLVARLKKEPMTRDFDLVPAIMRGVESWNEAFGFRALTVRMARDDSEMSRDDINAILIDTHLGQLPAWGQARANPYTGEIRGASVYFPAGWLPGTLEALKAAEEPDKKPPPQPMAASDNSEVRWSNMRGKATCALDPHFLFTSPRLPRPRRTAAEHKVLVEQVVESVIAHEIGHTLGLRHNFKGSFARPANSVMDYLMEEEAAATRKPGLYDVVTVRRLYGLAKEASTSPFCNDEQMATDPACARFDTGADPLREDVGPRFVADALAMLSKDNGTADQAMQWANHVLAYVRAGKDSATRVAALAIAFEVLHRVPDKVDASSAKYRVAVDHLARAMYARLYLDAAPQRGTVVEDPPAGDDALQTALAKELGECVLGTDGLRSWETRRVCVDVLRKAQSQAALEALLAAREALVKRRAALTGAEAVRTQDLVARIDRALAPYFDH